MHILIVEDETKIAKFLAEGLKAEGHTVTVCESFSEAKARIETTTESAPELAILDRMLGDQDGAKLIPLIKKASSDCKILILSAVSSADEKASCLDLGADDYIAKPFSLIELSARLRALGRRNKASEQTSIKIKNCEMDLLKHCVLVNSKKVELSQKEFQLLMIFMRHPSRVYNRFQILDQVWNTQYDIESNVVEVTINNLRRKLEVAGCGFEILSKRNVGYWIEA